MTEVVDAALAPCGRCWPVCYCGEINKDGICGNDEEECCTGPDDARDLLEKGEFKDDQEKLMEDLPSCCGKEISEIPVEILSKTKESCCGSSILPIDRKDIGSSNVSCGGCCAQSGSNCCSGGTEGELEKKLAGPIRVRTGGLGVIVCGPSSMIVSYFCSSSIQG